MKNVNIFFTVKYRYVCIFYTNINLIIHIAFDEFHIINRWKQIVLTLLNDLTLFYKWFTCKDFRFSRLYMCQYEKYKIYFQIVFELCVWYYIITVKYIYIFMVFIIMEI